MLPLPMAGLEVLQPKERRAAALGSVLVKPGVAPKDWLTYQGLLADRARWLIKENQGNALPLGEKLYQAGLLPWEESDQEVCLAALQSPQVRDHLESLGLDLPLLRPKDQERALARLQETPLEEWAAALVGSTES
jgi:hypothetical protein